MGIYVLSSSLASIRARSVKSSVGIISCPVLSVDTLKTRLNLLIGGDTAPATESKSKVRSSSESVQRRGHERRRQG